MTTRRRRSPVFRCGHPKAGSGLPCFQEVGKKGDLCATHRKLVEKTLATYHQKDQP